MVYFFKIKISVVVFKDNFLVVFIENYISLVSLRSGSLLLVSVNVLDGFVFIGFGIIVLLLFLFLWNFYIVMLVDKLCLVF